MALRRTDHPRPVTTIANTSSNCGRCTQTQSTDTVCPCVAQLPLRAPIQESLSKSPLITQSQVLNLQVLNCTHTCYHPLYRLLNVACTLQHLADLEKHQHESRIGAGSPGCILQRQFGSHMCGPFCNCAKPAGNCLAKAYHQLATV